MDVLADASEQLAPIKETIRARLPAVRRRSRFPAASSNSVTLSTMHGCPPDEIERIARYLLEERGLHTVVKLNPTLLGKERVLEILHDRLGFTEIDIPDSVFEHDLKYDRAVELIASLKARGRAARPDLRREAEQHAGDAQPRRAPAGRRDVHVGAGALPGDDEPLRPAAATSSTATSTCPTPPARTRRTSPAILSCGALPVTGCTDLLKPGGYRPHDAVAGEPRRGDDRGAAPRAWRLVARPAGERRAPRPLTRSSIPRYHKHAFPHGLPKVTSGLGLWDCVVAPCVEACAVEQDVPEYAWLIAQGEYDRALEVILARNPLPGVTGYVCTHLCQTRCTRNDYEESVAIRALKRIAEERGQRRLRRRRQQAAARRTQQRAPSRQRAVRACGGRVPGAERRAGDDLRGEGRAGRHDARGAAVPPAAARSSSATSTGSPRSASRSGSTPGSPCRRRSCSSRASTRSTWRAASSAMRRCACRASRARA